MGGRAPASPPLSRREHGQRRRDPSKQRVAELRLPTSLRYLRFLLFKICSPILKPYDSASRRAGRQRETLHF
jgi:hypothetical protein